MAQKRCWDCGETKDLNDFSKNRSKKGGRSHRCKRCKSRYRQQQRKRRSPKVTQFVSGKHDDLEDELIFDGLSDREIRIVKKAAKLMQKTQQYIHLRKTRWPVTPGETADEYINARVSGWRLRVRLLSRTVEYARAHGLHVDGGHAVDWVAKLELSA